MYIPFLGCNNKAVYMYVPFLGFNNKTVYMYIFHYWVAAYVYSIIGLQLQCCMLHYWVAVYMYANYAPFLGHSICMFYSWVAINMYVPFLGFTILWMVSTIFNSNEVGKNRLTPQKWGFFNLGYLYVNSNSEPNEPMSIFGSVTIGSKDTISDFRHNNGFETQ